MQHPLKTIHARAPIRVCDNGGWSDTWFAEYGVIFNIAMSPYAEVAIDVYPRAARTTQIEIFAENFGERFAHDAAWSNHPLIEAAVSRIGVPADCAVVIQLFCAVPAGASTGTSAAVTVALLAGLRALRGETSTPYALAQDAQEVETRMLGRQCGIQDQIAAAFGGICYIEMHRYPEAHVTQLALPDATLFELERRLALIFLGKTHDSSSVHERVIRELEDAGPGDARIEALRQTAPKSRDALLAADFAALGRAMIENTAAQAALNPALISADARQIIEIAQAHSALGWKVNGAGGDGGSLTLLCGGSSSAQRELLRAIEKAGPFRHIPTRFSQRGAHTWTA